MTEASGAEPMITTGWIKALRKAKKAGAPRMTLMAGNMTIREAAIRVLTERLHRDDAGVRSRDYVV